MTKAAALLVFSATSVAALVLGALALRSGDRSDGFTATRSPEADSSSDSAATARAAIPVARAREVPEPPFDSQPRRQSLTEPAGSVTVSGFVRLARTEPGAGDPGSGASVRMLLTPSPHRRIRDEGTFVSPDRFLPEPTKVIARGIADETGAFTLRAQVPASQLPATLTVRAEKTGWMDRVGPESYLGIESVPFERSGVVCGLVRSFGAYGLVVDANRGNPIPEARVRAQSQVLFEPGDPAPSARAAEATSDAEGRFSLDLGREIGRAHV